MIGESISHYKIIEKLGSGGMGIVYRALDENLGREVAIKVLHREVMHDPDRLSRFESEARAIAQLAHPNILAIHDFGNISGVAFAITELLEGETLGNRLACEHLQWRKAAAIAASIAEGLAAAHAKGITHRDIKPDNIFLTADGRVKILDFGLAQTGLPSITDPLAPTVSIPSTNGETVMGTVAYMTPEQLRGEPVDARSDIFALGCVLYEMLSGQSAFSRGSFALTVTAILMDPAPEVHVSGMDASMELNRIIGRCLEKNPKERFQSAGDLAFTIRCLLAEKHGFHLLSQSPHSSGAKPAMALTAMQKQKEPPFNSAIKSKWLRRILIPLALLCCLAVIGLWLLSTNAVTLAVLPPDNEAPDEIGWDENFAQKLHTKISELNIIKVRPLLTRQEINGMGSNYMEIAKKFNASVLLRWRYTITPENLSIYVELIDGRTGNAESKNFSRKPDLLMDTITQIAGYVVEKLRPKLGSAERKILACM